MARSHNFCPGPAALPEIVLRRTKEELLNFSGSGMSIREMSHRSNLSSQDADHAVSGFRKLLNISEEYDVLFMQGGATH